MRLLRLAESNVKKIVALDITTDPNDPEITIGGKNAAGKTSAIDGFLMAICGEKRIPGKPVRKGAIKAWVEADLGGMIVRREMRADGGTDLKVWGPEGKASKPLSSPQGRLDALYNKIAFDPAEFSRMKPQAQAEVLRKLVGLDTTKLDLERKAVYDRRTDAGREVAQLKARLDKLPVPPESTPAVEVSVADLVAELQKRADQLTGKTMLETAVRQAADAMGRAKSEVLRAKAALERAEDDLTTATSAHTSAMTKLSEYPEPLPTDEVKAQLAGAEATNRAVRQAKERKAMAEDLRRAMGVVENFTAELEQYDEAKREAIAAANFPVPGLGFDDSGLVTLNGFPLDQASAAEQLRLSVSIGFALHPELKVICIANGSLLDETSRRIIWETAKEAGGQYFLEVVSENGAGCTIHLVEGKQMGPDAPAESGPGQESAEGAA